MNKLLPALVSALVLAACAPSYAPYSVKPDTDLSCSDIRVELARARSANAEAASNRGLSVQNVAWAVFFLPGVLANEYTNDQVQRRSAERIGMLNRLYTAKRC